MNANERMFKLMKEKKVTQKRLADALNTTQSTIQGWKERGTIPNIEQLPTICEMLDISWEYLITGEEKQEYLNGDERKLLEQYRSANNTGKTRIMEYAQEMKRLHPEQEREPETEAKIS